MSRYEIWMENHDNCAILPILTHPDPILKQVSETVTQVDREVVELGHNMVATMLDAPGAGLAAVQVGVLRRMIAIDPALGKIEGPEPMVMVNPVLVESGPDIYDEEGCLSLPGVYSDMPRPGKIVVSYIDFDGNECRYVANGMVARAVVHEIEHLDGQLFWDGLPPLKSFWLKLGYFKRKLF